MLALSELTASFLTFYVFVFCFRMLAVISVSYFLTLLHQAQLLPEAQFIIVHHADMRGIKVKVLKEFARHNDNVRTTLFS